MLSKNIKQAILTTCLLCFAATLGAQTSTDSISVLRLPSQHNGVSVTASLDTTVITIGEQTILHINIVGSGNHSVRIPTEEELTHGAIEALESRTDTSRNSNGDIVGITKHVTITSFEAGRHLVGNVVVGIGENGTTVLLAPSDSLTIEVAYAADADTTKCEVAVDSTYIKEPYTFWEIVRWIVYGVLFAALVAAVVWVIKRRKEHKPIVIIPGAKPTPADKKALSELESLRRKELWQKGRIKKYYTDMTDIVRRFLRNMYGISAAEMTTRQTLKAFHGIEDWSEESESLLRQLLQKADMVKFAKSQPEAYEHDQAMQYAVDFVRKVAENHRINNPEKEEGRQAGKEK